MGGNTVSQNVNLIGMLTMSINLRTSVMSGIVRKINKHKEYTRTNMQV